MNVYSLLKKKYVIKVIEKALNEKKNIMNELKEGDRFFTSPNKNFFQKALKQNRKLNNFYKLAFNICK